MVRDEIHLLYLPNWFSGLTTSHFYRDGTGKLICSGLTTSHFSTDGSGKLIFNKVK
jgi:hypothetical protein